MIDYALPFALSALLTAALTPLARKLAFRVGAVDRPGATKIHTGAIARLGGVGVAAGAAGGLALALALGPLAGTPSHLDPKLWAPIAAGGAVVLALGIWD